MSKFPLNVALLALEELDHAQVRQLFNIILERLEKDFELPVPTETELNLYKNSVRGDDGRLKAVKFLRDRTGASLYNAVQAFKVAVQQDRKDYLTARL